MKTRAAVAWEANRPLEILEVDLADPGVGQVLIEMKATGLCHSDLGALEGKVARYPFPIVLGHEACGVVLACGEGVAGFAPGDVVVPSPMPRCGICHLCLSGKTNVCVEQWVLAKSNLSYKGEALASFCGTATFAEHSVISQNSLAKVNPAASPAGACYVGCGVMTGVGSVTRTAGVEPGSTVAIFGLGGIGLNVVQGAKLAGARQIIGVDINPAREAIGRQMGLTHFIDGSKEDAVAKIVELTAGGSDYCFDCVGNVELARQAVQASHPAWGKSVAVGIPGPGSALELDPRLFITGRVWTGSLLGGENPKEAIPRLVEWYLQGYLKVDELISHRITLDEINHGFDMMRSGEAVRTVVTF
ncbi:zinc-binding dehydrogenase [Sphingopyxis sp.]|uniref:zinc-binding dehydrogenase n=1 Tax=Sphingopyxis sp. TaxID=1908224 RepID=UPI003D6CC3F2